MLNSSLFMPVSPSRLAAFEILLRVEQQDAYASELLHSERLAGLSSADRGLCMEIVMGVLRWRSFLDECIAAHSFTPFRKLDPQVLAALRIGAYQLLFLERIPARAAVNESVELVKTSKKASAAGLANAVLRKIHSSKGKTNVCHSDAERGEAGESAASPGALARRLAHPLWIVERWICEYGAEAAAAICRFDQTVPATSLRMPDASVESELKAEGIELAPGTLLTSARCYSGNGPGEITRTRAYAEGRVAIQDEGSQLVALLVGRGKRILDCCAAPGGKTAAIATRNPGAKIVAADLHEHRVRLMRKLVHAPNVNMIAADSTNFDSVSGDARALIEGEFDRILADVPCSGTGTLARNPEIKWKLKPEDFAELHGRQVAILRAAIAKVAPGGRLVYSTCSLEHEENEAVIEEVLRERDDLTLRDCAGELRQMLGELAVDPASLARGPYLRTIPGVHACDGFFAAVIGRNS
jgi:16S rRNA (cytosine967-C5)-methyltransferase